MSQALTVATRADGAVVGGSPRVGGRPSPMSPAGPRKARTPLSLVPARQVRHRVPFAVFSLIVLAAALAAVLMINISVSSTQYDLVQLRNQQVGLTQENEALVLEIEGREAPQNLAAAATKLKMVSSSTFGTLDLDAKTVSGEPEPAKEGVKPEVLIAAPDLVTEEPAPAALPAPLPVEEPSRALQRATADEAPVANEPAVDGGIPGGTIDGAADGADAGTSGGVDDGTEADAGAAAGTIPGPLQTGGNG